MVQLDRVLSHLTVDVEPFALCTLATGWRLRLPPPPDAMLHFVLKGSGVVRGPHGLRFPIHPYSLAVVPSSSPHALECGLPVTSERVIEAVLGGHGTHQLTAGPEERPALRVASGLIRARYGESLALFGRMPELLVADLSRFPQARAAFESILAEQQDPKQGGTALTRALMGQCLVYFFRSLSERDAGVMSCLTALEDPELGNALDAMLDDPGANHTVESLADCALMSRSTFAVRFHASFGETPLGFLHEIRMCRAAVLLQQHRHVSIERVAKQVGFSSRSRFSAAFKARFDVTPAVFRATTD